MSSFRTQLPRIINLLLVEDDDGDAKALARAFKKARISNNIVRAVDGVDALEILKGINDKVPPPSPCILLVDLNMPRMNGIELIKALRSDDEWKRSIVFVLTTSKRDEDKQAAYDLNVAGYISKATVAEDFLSLISLIDLYVCIMEMP
jgi:CheY-like chemotaxis protein